MTNNNQVSVPGDNGQSPVSRTGTERTTPAVATDQPHSLANLRTSPGLPSTTPTGGASPQLPILGAAPASTSNAAPHPFAGLEPESPHLRPAMATPVAPKMGIKAKYTLIGAAFGLVAGLVSHSDSDSRLAPHVLKTQPNHVVTSAATDEALKRQSQKYSPPPAREKSDNLNKFRNGPEGPGMSMSMVWGILAGGAIGLALGRFKVGKMAEHEKMLAETLQQERAARNAEYAYLKNMHGTDEAARAAMGSRYPETWGAAANNAQAKAKPSGPQ